MTMIPNQNLPKLKKHRRCSRGYGGGGGGVQSESIGDDDDDMTRLEFGYYVCSSEACVGSDLVIGPMAEDDSRTESVNETGSSSKETVSIQQERERDHEWLQLGIGSGHVASTGKLDPSNTRRAGLVELDLLAGAGGGGGSQKQQQQQQPQLMRPFPIPALPVNGPEFRAPNPRPVLNFTSTGGGGYRTPPFFLQQQQQQQQEAGTSSVFPHHHQQLQESIINWGFRPIQRNIMLGSTSSSSSPSYFTRPFQMQPGVEDIAGPSLDFRIIDPLRRPHSGVWFMLQASQNQGNPPFLPQIPKSYLRIKDGRVTVRLVMKYLVNKLKLDNESEVEVTCRGQQLLPFLTLQHVRDNIWTPPPPPPPSRDHHSITLLPDSSTADHLMVLHYARSTA